ncbi:MAG: PD40 domain-containing protein, partial [Anaerolineae bacterium]|nr:PD40 domain-containing protein [Anaerolineae bacterium]
MMDTNHVFPFVGPRTFEESDRHLFFGREPEAQDLLSLVMAERLVLFYASSGAGKSSLLNARLRPDLRQAGFALLPLGRVCGSLPDHLGPVDNVFSFNLILSLDQNRHEASSFARTTLRDYLQIRPDQSDQETPYVLMIDQFEEIFSTNLEHWGQREEFFRQLREAMTADSQLWVVLAMREDYVAALDPYARLLPGKLRTRYYMRPLGYEAALAAIRQPAEWGGRPFAAGVAEQLVDNLRQVKLQGQTEVSHLGEFVEPVQLQVVCYRLWQNLTERPLGPITHRDLAEAGDVDTALAQFYEQALAAVTTETGEAEIEVRTWFESQLITEAGTRGTVYQGETHSGGLANHTAELLAGHHLLRRELRAGGTWYELVHDRMIDPILQANQAWRLKQPLIQIAQAWADSGRSPNLLLDERQLEEALATKWSALGPLVKAFLEASQQHQAARAEARLVRKEIRRQQQLRQSRRFATTLALLLMVAMATAIFAFTQQRRAQWETEQAVQAKAVADANGLALKAKDVLGSQPKEGLLLAVKALTTTLTPYQFRVPAAEQVLRQALAEIGGRPLRGYPQDIVAVALSPGRHLLATGSQDGLVRLWDPKTGREVGDLAGHQAAITALGFSPNDGWLATADEAGLLRLWDLTIDNPANHTLALAKQMEPVTALGFSPDGNWLVTGGNRGAVLLWNLSQPDRPVSQLPLAGHDEEVNRVTFSPDGRWLASSSFDGTARLWQMTGLAVAPVALPEAPEGNLSLITFSADSAYLAAGGLNGQLWLWPVSHSMAEPIILTGHGDTISALAFSLDGRWLVTGSYDGTARLWDVSNFRAAPLTLPGITETVATLAFSPDSTRLAAGSGNFVVLWNLSHPDLLTTPTILRGHSKAVLTVAFSAEGRWLISNGNDQTVRVWDVFNLLIEPQQLVQLDAGLMSLAFSADGCRLAAGSIDNATRLWNMAVPSTEPDLLQLDRLSQVVAFSPQGELLATG